MLGGAERPHRDFAVLGASVLRIPLAVVGTVNVHLAAAVGAVHQARQRRRLAPAVRVTLDVAPDTLNIVKQFLRDNGLMRVLENHPVTFIDIAAFLVLEVFAGLEVDGMPQILTLFEDMDDCGRSPAIGILDVPALVRPLAVVCQMDGGNLDFVLFQPGSDLIGAVSLHGHIEDTADNGGSFIIHHPILPLLVPQIAVDYRPGNVLAAHALCLENGLDFLAYVPAIVLVHDVAEGEEIIVPPKAVYTVIDSD